MGRPGTAALPRPQRGMSAVGDNAGTHHRNTASTDSARPKNGTHLRRKYSLLAPTRPADNPTVAGNQVRGDGHKATIETAD